jgi:hypothetical protein
VSNSVQRRAGDGVSLTCLPPALQWLPSSGHEQMRSLHTSHCISLGPVRGLTGRQSPVNQLDKDGQTFALELAAPIYGDIATEFYDSSSSQLSGSASGLRSSQHALQPTRRDIEDGYNALRRLSSILFLLTARRQTARIYILDDISDEK